MPDYLGTAPLAAAFEKAFAEGTDGSWDSLVEEVGPRVWTFPLLSRDGCTRLLAEIDRRVLARADEDSETGAPNSMHGYGVILGEIGMDGLLADLGTRWLVPLMLRHFEDTGARTIDGRHGFLVDYGKGSDDSLGFHVDDSAVTLNLCLGEDFSGSEIYFRGLRCDRHRQTSSTPVEEFEFEHEVGTAILHAGRHRHGVHPIRRGRRRNLILWLQSSQAKRVASECQSWCAAHRS